jgi:hypothetical protein
MNHTTKGAYLRNLISNKQFDGNSTCISRIHVPPQAKVCTNALIGSQTTFQEKQTLRIPSYSIVCIIVCMLLVLEVEIISKFETCLISDVG